MDLWARGLVGPVANEMNMNNVVKISEIFSFMHAHVVSTRLLSACACAYSDSDSSPLILALVLVLVLPSPIGRSVKQLLISDANRVLQTGSDR